MRDLKIQITRLLKNICPRVYFENAPDTAVVPYLVYDFTQGNENQGQLILVLDVDVWDKNTSSANIDTLSKQLRRLHGSSYIDGDIQFALYFDRILNSKSESKEWKRNTVIFEVRMIERS